MPRQIQITIPSGETDHLVEKLRRAEGVVGLRVQRGIALKPPGDVVTLEVTDRSLSALMRLLDEKGISRSPGSSISTSEPLSLISPDSARMVTRDTSESTWEEMEHILTKESSMTANALAVMAVAGFLAVVGIGTGTLHLVIAAMVVAPGFEPLTRIALGAVTGSAAWWRGLSSTVRGYVALLLGAAVAAAVLRATGTPLLAGEGSYVRTGALVSYWTSPTISSIPASAVASVAGALLVASNRSTLTAGVMIALALIPSASLVSVALVAGDWQLAGKALLRWAVDAGLVIAFSSLVFAWKRFRVHQRGMAL